MGKPYSLDLRKRVVSAIEGGMSRNQAAKQFGIAISTAILQSAPSDRSSSLVPKGIVELRTGSGEMPREADYRDKRQDQG
jgi:transposase